MTPRSFAGRSPASRAAVSIRVPRETLWTAGQLARPTTANPNDVFVACDMADVAKATAFTASKSLANAMRKAGIVGRPVFYFLGLERYPTRRSSFRAA